MKQFNGSIEREGMLQIRLTENRHAPFSQVSPKDTFEKKKIILTQAELLYYEDKSESTIA